MARKKDGKSLFEVMGAGESQSGKSLDVPSWFDRGGQASDEASKASQPVSSRPVPAGQAERREPVLSVSAGRLIISLNQVSAIVVVLAIILLGVGAFFLGRRTSQNASASPGRIQAQHNRSTTQLGDEPVNVLPRPDSPKPRPGGTGMVRDDAQRQKGYSYLVIQGGIHTLKEAMDIKQFLYDKGIDATVHRSTHTGMYMVKDMHGFRNISSEQTRAAVAEYVAHIERLGKEYLRQGGRYGFKQRSSTGVWMITER